jgi:hypothetical protein
VGGRRPGVLPQLHRFRWLDGHDRWLLVLDNAAAPDTATGLDRPLARLVDLIPQVLHGQVLVTSRDASWEEHATLAELDLFTSEEAVLFLQGRVGSGEGATARSWSVSWRSISTGSVPTIPTRC